MVFDVLPFELLLLFIPTGRMGRAPNVCDDGSIERCVLGETTLCTLILSFYCIIVEIEAK
jgi:hypothetical protein